MKKVILALAVVTFFAACNGEEATDAPKTDSPAVAAPAVADSPVVKVDSPAVKVDSPAVKK